jgi:hypothetical protein
MRIIELENRCTGNRTVGSNPTLFATIPRNLGFPERPTGLAAAFGEPDCILVGQNPLHRVGFTALAASGKGGSKRD